MSSLHQLKADNARLEERLSTLTNRKNQLLQVNVRLATPMSCTSTSSTTTPNVTKQSTPTASGAVTATSQGSLSTETRTTQSNEGPRGTISAGADGAPKVDVPQSTGEGKVPMSANVKPASITGGNDGTVKKSKSFSFCKTLKHKTAPQESTAILENFLHRLVIFNHFVQHSKQHHGRVLDSPFCINSHSFINRLKS